jgi:hypothetical protein
LLVENKLRQEWVWSRVDMEVLSVRRTLLTAKLNSNNTPFPALVLELEHSGQISTSLVLGPQDKEHQTTAWFV